MVFRDQDLVAEFVVESQEGLANVESQLLALENVGGDLDADLVNSVFRTMHSIKGAAGFLGLDKIESLAHGLEEILNGLRNREIVPSSELVTSSLRAADFMKELIDAVETSNEVEVGAFVAELQKFRPGAVEAQHPSPSAETQRSEVSSGPAPSLSEAVREFLVECYENLEQMDRDLLSLEQSTAPAQAIRNVFRTLHTIKGGAGFLGMTKLERLAHVAENVLSRLRNETLEVSEPLVSALLLCSDKCREGLRAIETRGDDAGFDPQPAIDKLLPFETTRARLESAERKEKEGEEGSSSSAHAPVAAASGSIAAPSAASPAESSGGEKTAPSIGESTVRVDVSLLDTLMTRVGELVLARNQILQHTNAFDPANFVSTAQRLNLLTTELQECVMKTRMQPIGNVWSKFPRVVRDLSSQLGKQVRIEMEGKETELDKTIVEAIKDPLTHLVRNAVDHGLETPEARVAAGKPAEGRVLLRAYHEGGQVNIEISDDGAGLRLDRIRKKAVERGIVSSEQASRMSDREASQLILLPGFSTAEQVTSVSGRGVGMDVVKTNIERTGGTIDLQSRPGQGTTIRIKIPLTLAIIPALIVADGGERFAIPQATLLELVRLEGEQARKKIERYDGAPVYRLRGKLLPLVSLSERLGRRNPTEVENESERASVDEAVNIVVLRANDRQFGLIVDDINDTEEIVVKPLSRQLKGIREYAGATIMGDGAVALILDVVGLAHAAGLAGELRERCTTSDAKTEESGGRSSETLLLVDAGDARRFALPTSMVSRLEKAPRSAVEYAEGREAIQYRGAILPLVRISDAFGSAAPETTEEELQIVVYSERDHACGLVVRRILDIVETDVDLASRSTTSGLLGTTVIDERVTDVLDMRALSRRSARPLVGA